MIRKQIITLIIFFSIALVSACTAPLLDKKDNLEVTIEAQSTQLAVLNTQVAEQEQSNWSQWDAISYLSTQMPLARGWITPIPEGITITPTAYIELEYPPGTRTGDPEIDRVIEVFMSGNLGDRLELVRLMELACTKADGLGGPPKCEGDETEGTIVTVHPVLYSEGVHVRPDDLESVFDFTIRGLFAVYVVPESAYDSEDWPAGETAIVFTSEDGGHPHTITLHVIGEEVVRLEFGTGWLPFDQIWDRSDTFILPPSTRQRPTPQLVVCTPPACEANEVYHCPDECPGGCGTTCATVTPREDSDK